MFYSTPESSIQGKNIIELQTLNHHLDILDIISSDKLDERTGYPSGSI